MNFADKYRYLSDIVTIMKTPWPANRTINIVCHGHSVPAGYFATPFVDTFNAYPHLLHLGLKARFPNAVINVIVTSIGGESSDSGSARFQDEVLCHRPDVLTIDYGLNDRRLGVNEARENWRIMIEQSLAAKVKVILMTPTIDNTFSPGRSEADSLPLREQAESIRGLAQEYNVALVDSLELHLAYLDNGGDISELLSQSNHPSRLGHELVSCDLLGWFPFIE